MVCDAFYANPSHSPFSFTSSFTSHEGSGGGDRCNRNEIAAGTATNFSILGMTTSLCGTLNLFVAGWTVKRFGPRLALMVQTLVPAVRVATQILGVVAGGQAGIWIFQGTQLITVLGGPAGYMYVSSPLFYLTPVPTRFDSVSGGEMVANIHFPSLVINIIAGEVVEPLRRTAVFGMLQGCIMLGQGVGYLSQYLPTLLTSTASFFEWDTNGGQRAE